MKLYQPNDACPKCERGHFVQGPSYEQKYSVDGKTFSEWLKYSCNICGAAILMPCKDAALKAHAEEVAD